MKIGKKLSGRSHSFTDRNSPISVPPLLSIAEFHEGRTFGCGHGGDCE